MIECAARLLRFADELEEGDHVDPRVSLLRYGVEAVVTLAGAMDRDASMAGHEGPSSAEADELRHKGYKVIQFACALGFDAVDEACDSEEENTTSAAPAASTRRKRRLEKKEHKPSRTKRCRGAWNQNHASRPGLRVRLLNSAGRELTFRQHLAGLDVVVAPLDGAKAARSINGMREDWNAKRPTKGSFYTYSGTKGLSSQNRGPAGGAHDAFDKPGLRPIKEAITAEDGLMVNYRFMPGGHERVQDAHADGGDPKVSRLLATLHTGPNQPPANLEFQMRKDPAQHPRSAVLVVDPATGQPFKHVVQKGHGTVVIGDGAAFGREGSLIHQVTAAQGGRGGRGGSVTILVDIEFPEEATKEQRRTKQRNIAGRLASLAGSTSYATELKNPGKGNVDASKLSTTNTAHNNTVVRRRDGTSTTRAALQGKADYAEGAALPGGGTSKGTRKGKGAGATAPLKPTTAAQSAYQRMVAAGKTPTRQGVNFTGPEKKRTKSTNELKGEGGKASIKKRRRDPQKFKDDCAAGGKASIKKRRRDPQKFKDDCAAGATADLRPETIAHPAHQRTVAKGKTPSRSNVNKTAEERGSTKSTSEGKADGANVAHVDAATGVLVRRDAPGAVRITEGGAALKGRHGDVRHRKKRGRGGENAHKRGGRGKKADVTLAKVTRVGKVTPEQAGFHDVRCTFIDPITGVRCGEITPWNKKALKDLRPSGKGEWIAVVGTHQPSENGVRLHSASCAPWRKTGKAVDDGECLIGAKGVKYLMATQASVIVSRHQTAYKELLASET